METGVCMDIIASGNIPNTDIGININADGTVDVTTSVLTDNSTASISTIYDPVNNKVVIAYRDISNFNYGTAIVGTISGDSISFGTPLVFNSVDTNWISAVYDPVNNKVVIAYRNNYNNEFGVAIVGTISNDTIVFNKPVVFSTNNICWISATYNIIDNKVVIAYCDSDNNWFGTAIVGTISGDNISFGLPVVFSNNDTWYISTVYDSTNNKVVIAYCNDNNNNNSSFGTAIVGTVSGNSIIFGTPVVFNNTSTWSISAVYDSANNKIVIAYYNGDDSGFGAVIVGTVSGDSITFSSPVVFNNNNTNWISAKYDVINNKIIIAYHDKNNSGIGTIIVGTIFGNNIFFESPVVFNNAYTEWISAVYIPTNNKIVIACNSNDYGVAITGTISDTNISFKSPVVFNSPNIWNISAMYTPVDNKVTITFSDNIDFSTDMVGTVSGNNIIFKS